MSDIFDMFLGLVEVGAGMSELKWEKASAPLHLNKETRMGNWEEEEGENGVIYAAPVIITGLFRDQTRYLNFRREGEIAHGSAQLTTMLEHHIGYVDRRVRDRITVIPSQDGEEERVFFPSAQASPFIINNIQRAWRVTLQSADETVRLAG